MRPSGLLDSTQPPVNALDLRRNLVFPPLHGRDRLGGLLASEPGRQTQFCRPGAGQDGAYLFPVLPQECHNNTDAVVVYDPADDFDAPLRYLDEFVPQRGHDGEFIRIEYEPDGLEGPAVGEGAK